MPPKSPRKARRPAGRPSEARIDRKWIVGALACGLLVLTVLTFAPVRDFEFVNYDDLEYIVENPHVAGGLTADNLRWAWQNPYSGTGGPVTWMSHMLDVELFGLSAGWHHVTSLVLHASSALVLFLVLRTMTGATWRSAFVAALFAVHPLHVESVAWVAERKDVLSGLFFFLTIGAFSWYVRQPGILRYMAVVVLFVLGLLSKPMIVTLPFVLLLLDFWPLQRLKSGSASVRTIGRLVLEKVPLIALGVVSMMMTLQSQADIGAVSTLDTIPLQMRISNAIVSYAAYLGKTVWPAGLVPHYPYRTAISAALVTACVALLGTITIAAIGLARRASYVSVGWLWYVGMLVPVIGLVQVGGHAMADRFTYLPLTGIFVAATWGVHRLAASAAIPRWALAASAVVIVTTCAVTARAQAMHWQNGLALWEHTVRVDPANARAFSNLGVALAVRNRQEEAIRAYERALALQPGVPETHHNLGLALMVVGRSDEALGHFERAVSLDPGYAKARMHLAILLGERGRTEEAIQQYGEAVRLAPQDPLIRANLSITLDRSSRTPEAIPHMLEAVQLDPRNVQWRYLAAVMMIDAGQRAEAANMLQEVLALDPAHGDARRALEYLKQ